MIKPIININGTSAKELIEYRRAAIIRIDDLMKDLLQITPNGRDYPGHQDRCIQDRKLHYDRIESLSALRNDLMQEAVAIMQNGDVA